ncbi:MAG: type II methionyl aminopeptidase [Candidatus Aenigmatarchaeota archaeon]|nr:MAG: type II methionyl aminopeptidase [Candidatus Aenigmarchaeota archaeon]
MDSETLEKYKKAGEISKQVKKEVLEKIKPGMRILELAEFIEKRALELGGRPAFPVNIGINDITAHYTPQSNDSTAIKPGDLVKIDHGIHVDGWVADMAYTYCSGKNELINVVEKALEAGIKVIKPGIKISEISQAISETVDSAGFGVIVNLTGHGLDQYVVHGPPTIPNVKNDSQHALKEGDVIALEPFVCKTNGYVKESEPIEIFSFLQPRPVRLPEARKIIELGDSEYNGLPFCKRWLVKMGLSPFKVSFALKQLEISNSVKSYPVLRERSGSAVAQAEHTIVVEEKPLVITL